MYRYKKSVRDDEWVNVNMEKIVENNQLQKII